MKNIKNIFKMQYKNNLYSKISYFALLTLLSLTLSNCSPRKFTDQINSGNKELSSYSNSALMDSPFRNQKVLINVAAENNMKPKMNTRNESVAPSKGVKRVLATRNALINKSFDLALMANVSCLTQSSKLKDSFYYISDKIKFPITNRLLKNYQIFSLKLEDSYSVEELESFVQNDNCIIGISNNEHYKANAVDDGSGASGDPMSKEQTHHSFLKTDEAYERLFSEVAKDSNSKVIVAVIDTGVDVDHPDLKDVIWTSPLGEKLINFGGGIDADVGGHGTHVAGLIGAIGNNGIGVKGTAQGISIMAIKASTKDLGYFSFTDTSNSILYATQNKADVINMSLGAYYLFTSGNYLYHEVIRLALLSNVTFFIAAGNDFGDPVSNPGTLGILPGVITIGSLDVIDGEHSLYSNVGPEIDLWAPGAHNYVLLPDGKRDTINTVCLLSTGSLKVVLTEKEINAGKKVTDYVRMCGTSMATPISAGVGAMVIKYFKSRGISYTPETVEDVMRKSSIKKANGDLQLNFLKIAEEIESYTQDSQNYNLHDKVGKFLTHAIISFLLPPSNQEDLNEWSNVLNNRSVALEDISQYLLELSLKNEKQESVDLNRYEKIKTFILGSSSQENKDLSDFIKNKYGKSVSLELIYLISKQRIEFFKSLNLGGYPVLKVDLGHTEEEIKRIDDARWLTVRELNKAYNRFPTYDEVNSISELLYSGRSVDAIKSSLYDSNEYYLVSEMKKQLDCYMASLYWNHPADTPIPVVAEVLKDLGTNRIDQKFAEKLVAESTEKNLITLYKSYLNQQPSCYDMFSFAKRIRLKEITNEDYIAELEKKVQLSKENGKFNGWYKISLLYIAGIFVRNYIYPKETKEGLEWFDIPNGYYITKNEFEHWNSQIKELNTREEVFQLLRETNNGKVADYYIKVIGWSRDDYKNNYNIPLEHIQKLNDGYSFDLLKEELSVSDDKFIRDEYKKYNAYPSFGVWEYYHKKLQSNTVTREQVAQLISKDLLIGSNNNENNSDTLLKITCSPTSTSKGATVTCIKTSSNLKDIRWFVENVGEIVGCAGKDECTFKNVPVGVFNIYIQGKDSSSKVLKSESVVVTVAEASISVTCNPKRAATGSKVTCTATKNNLSEISWFLGDTQVPHCINKDECSFDKVPVGVYNITAQGKTESGKVIKSPIVTVTVEDAFLSISCSPRKTVIGTTVRCNAIGGNIIEGNWYVDEKPILNCANKGECNLESLNAREYKVYAQGKSVAGKILKSNIVTVAIEDSTISITCDPTHTAKGEQVKCTSTLKNIVESNWYVGDTKVSYCANQTECIFKDVPVGAYVVTVQGKNLSGQTFKSNIETVKVDPALIKVRCLPGSLFGGSGDSLSCMANAMNIQTFDWYLDNSKNNPCTNLKDCNFEKIPVGKHEIYVQGKDASGKIYNSKIIPFEIKKNKTQSTLINSATNSGSNLISSQPSSSSSKIKVLCTPSSLYAGSSVKCTTVITGEVSIKNWVVGSKAATHCANKSECIFEKVPAGVYNVKVEGKNKSGILVTSNTVTVNVTSGLINIACTPSSAVAGATITCKTTDLKNISTGNWYVGSTKVAHCANKTECVFQNVPVGSYKVYAQGNNSSGETITSKAINVNVAAPTIKVSCTLSTTKPGSTVKCTASGSNIKISDWLVGTTKVAQCANKTECVFQNVPKGIYNVKAQWNHSSGSTIKSNSVIVTVK